MGDFRVIIDQAGETARIIIPDHLIGGRRYDFDLSVMDAFELYRELGIVFAKTRPEQGV